jgi:hypothetical protein
MAESHGSDQAGVGNLIEAHLKKVYTKILKDLASRKHVELKKSCENALGTSADLAQSGVSLSSESATSSS